MIYNLYLLYLHIIKVYFNINLNLFNFKNGVCCGRGEAAHSLYIQWGRMLPLERHIG